MITRPSPPLIGANNALFLDFDGTLAALQDDPETVQLPETSRSAIIAFADQLGGAVAIVTGRDIRDIDRRVPRSIWRAGGHGVEICAPNQPPAPEAQPAPSELSEGFADVIAPFDEVWCEPKGPIIAVHYRQNPEAKDALGTALHAVVERLDGYKLQAGKMVFEAKPVNANKGKAVAALMREAVFADRTPIMLGDDVTDEDGFKAVHELGGFAVKVGEGDSVAEFGLASTHDVSEWLQESAAQ